MEVITGIISRIMDGPDAAGDVYLKAEQETERGLVVIRVGGKSRLKAGDAFRAEGVFKGLSRNGEPTFRASAIRPELPVTEKGIERWLKGIFNSVRHGISAESIERLVSARGSDIVNKAVADPSVILSLTSDVSRYRAAILEDWTTRTSARRAVTVMEKSGLEPLQISRILGAYPDDAYGIIIKDPYKTAPLSDVGFMNADKIGEHLGIDRAAKERILAACSDVLRKNESTGSTAMNFSEFMTALTRTTKLELPMLQEFVLGCAKDNSEEADFRLFRIESQGYSANPSVGIIRKFFYSAESRIARGISSLLVSGFRPLEERVKAESAAMFEETPAFRHFDSTQRLAVTMAVIEPFSILTGGPGTGKSTVMKAVAALHARIHKGALYLTAPTGKAAERLAETTGQETSTVQSLLGQIPGADGQPNSYNHNKFKPLKAGCTVAVDEASMLDVETMAALLDALPPDGRILLVGDRNQLPSVGAGDVIANLLSTRIGERLAVPSTGLVKVYRQGADSGIALGADLINHGQVPEITEAGENGVSFSICDDADIMEKVDRLIVKLVETEGLDPYRDIAIIIPQAPGRYGTHAFNRRMSERFNKNGAAITGVFPNAAEKTRGVPVPRSGDRIMIAATEKIKNLKGEDIKITNGDMGFITGMQNENGRTHILVRTDSGKEFRIPGSSWRNIPLAYAGNVHKSQGSQYKHVIMVFAEEHERMMERTLVYTGWTRAQLRLHCFGSPQVFEAGIRRWNGNSRMTMLPSFIRSLKEEGYFPPNSTDWEARQLAGAVPAAASNPIVFPVRPAVRPPPPLPGKKVPSFMARKKTSTPSRPLPSFRKPASISKLGPMGAAHRMYTANMEAEEAENEEYDNRGDEP